MGKYPTLPGDSVGAFAQEFRAQRRQLRESARPSGTQMNERTTLMPRFDLASETATSLTILPLTVPIDLAVATLTVPAGYSTALVQLSARVGLLNTATGGWGNLRIQSRIQDDLEGPLINSVSGGEYGSGNLTQVKILNGLGDGEAITIAVQGAFAATYGNAVAAVNASAIFIR